MNNIIYNIGVFRTLCERDIKIFRHTLLGTFIDTCITLAFEILLVGYLYPAMGMPSNYIGPLFVGSIFFTALNIAFNTSIERVFELREHGSIFYHISLPCTTFVVFIQYILSITIRILLLLGPLLFLGVRLLSLTAHTNFVSALGILLYLGFSVSFIATFSLWLAYFADLEWYIDNVWPRILAPTLDLSATFFIWKSILRVSTVWAFIFLASPFTHMTEGLRSLLFAPSDYLPLSICLVALLAMYIGLIWLLKRAIVKTIDPVL